MQNNSNIIEWIPYAFRDIVEFQALAAAEDFEIDELHAVLETMMNDQFINDATETGIRRWERMLGINPALSATLDERRWAILNKLNINIPYTITMLRNKLTALYGEDFKLKVISDSYLLKVDILETFAKTLASTREMLDVIVPANMNVIVKTYSTNTSAVLGQAVLGQAILGRS